MNISSYIIILLEEHEYVILPGLGAFIAVYQPALLINEGRTMLPPTRRISFNPDLKINDGLLAGFLARQLKISPSRANKILEQYSEELIYRLDQDGKVVFDHLGILRLENNQFLFEADSSTVVSPGSFGLEPVAAEPVIPAYCRPVEPEEKKQKRKTSYWTWAASFALFIGILSLIWLGFFREKPVPVVQPVAIPNDTLLNPHQFQASPVDSAAAILPGIQAPKPEYTLPKHPRKELYYTIGGSFKSKQNAEDYFRKMSEQGYHPLQLGLIRNFWVVALDTFLTEKEAAEAADRFTTQHPNADMWIYHRE